MGKIKKSAARILALLLVLTLCFSFLPSVSTAYAEGEATEVSTEQGTENDTESGTEQGTENGTEAGTETGTYSRGEPKDPVYETVPGAGSLDGVVTEDGSTTTVSRARRAPSNTGSMEVMKFTWNGTEYTMTTGNSGSGTGISWTCDADGNFTMNFTASGTLVLTMGSVTNSSVKLIGGGAGGSSAYASADDVYGRGGSGGGAGSIVESEVTVTEGVSISVVVGAGGTGGSPSTTGPEYYIDGNSGSAGGDTKFGSLTAAGGKPNAGGAGGSGTAPGSAAASGSRGGGGGGTVSNFQETDCGNYRWGNYSCFICGTNEGYYQYTYGWSAWNPGNVSGGAGDNGGGTGGYPENQHGHGPRDGGNGTDGTGAGGGGGAFATWTYNLGTGKGHSDTGSAERMGYAGKGGNGGSGAATLSGHAEGKAIIKITKTSANSAMTDGNSCYSLAGAVYGVYSDAACETLVEQLTTDASGYAESSKLERAVYYVKEITAPKGYLKDEKVYTADGSKGGSINLAVKDTPANDPVIIAITKITDDPATTLPSLAGTQFTVKFYAGQYTSVSELPAATRTWVIETKAITSGSTTTYSTMLDEGYKVSGDDFYYIDGMVSFPLGTVTIQETKPAEGYTTIGGYAAQAGTTIADASGIILLNVTEDMSLASGGTIKYGNEYTKTDKPIYGGVSVQKFDAETAEAAAQGGATLKGAKFSIVSMNEKDITVSGTVYSKGDTVYTGETDEDGLFTTADDLLPAGSYKIVETAAPAGYLLSGKTEAEFEITEDGVIVELGSADTAIADKPIRADFSLEKLNGDTKEPMAGVEFTITSNTTGESYSFKTGADGTYSSKGDSSVRFGSDDGEDGALLYDTYTIEEQECAANKGYTLAEPITVKVDGASVLVQVVGVYNYQMRMSTTASFTTGEQWSIADGTVTANDSVAYENLKAGTEYKLVGKLYNKSTGAFLTDADGNEITAEKSFTANGQSGVQSMSFTFDCSALAGTDVVVYEYLYTTGKDEPILTHENPEDEGQTLHFPAIGTTAKDAANGTAISLMADEISIVDTVEYTGLKPGTEHTVKGKLMDKATGEAAKDADGKEITAEATFTPAAADGSVDVTFTFSGNFETAQIFVAYEDMYMGKQLVAVHADISDEGQTVYIPKIGTSAKDAATGKSVAKAEGTVSITDTVSYDGLKPGESYTLSGKLVLKSDADTVLAEAESTFTASETGSGTTELTFSLDASELAGKATVVFESVSCGDAEVAVHADIDDEGQTIYFPEIGTKVTDASTGTNVSLIADEVTIVDTVSYEGLKTGVEYTVAGKLMDKASGAAAKDADGNEITAEATFTPEESSGTVDVTFTFNGSFETAKKLVAFETLSFEDVEVAVHADIEDAEQTVYMPKIKTSAIAPVTGEHLGAAGDMKVTDTVTYTGLKPGIEYVLYGLVVNADEPDVILGGSMAVFTPESEDGQQALELTVDAKEYAAKTVVVYETLMIGNKPVAVHQDAGDTEQQILIPGIKTSARDAELGGSMAVADEEVEIIDTVTYENLIPGKTYTLTGKLVLKSDADTVLATSESTFKPIESSGSVELSFTFDGSKLAGDAAVAFETLSYNGAELAVHADINDADQTVVFPAISTTATIENKKTATARDKITLRDSVYYKNLIAGETYTVTGTLMDKSTGKAIRDADGKEITATQTFTAEEANGTVWMSFVFNGSNMYGKTIVAFEQLYRGVDINAEPIAVHEDINSVDQSVAFTGSNKYPKTGDSSNIALWTAVAVFAAVGAAGGAWLLGKRKKEQ